MVQVGEYDTLLLCSHFEGNSPVDGFGDDWLCWFDNVIAVGDRLVLGGSSCGRLEEVVVV